MTRRFRIKLAVVTLIALIASASVALAFTQPMVLYKPPVVKMFDIDTSNSVENMVVNQDGNFLLFSSTPVQVAMHPDSDPGCDIDVSVGCPKEGIKKIVMNLGAMNDSGEFDLDSNTADKIKQIAKGGADNDDLKGRDGAQILKGGEGNDELDGGPGKDTLIGGPGIDFCDGGPGKDTIKDCEPPPMRTFQPTVLYMPPALKLKDHFSHDSIEDIKVRRDGSDFTLVADGSSPPTTDPASDPGCEFILSGVSCPRVGITQVTLLLGPENDVGDIDLGASADKVKQTIKGQDDNDDLFGGAGTQRLVGGEGDDELEGGPGKDVLIGGPGLDICDGGPGKDTIKDCEPPPMR